MTGSPADIAHELDREALTIRAIVETPAGSKGKFTFDPDTGLYSLGKLLPVGLTMPVDFGFVPSTCGGDGDPLDIVLLSEVELPTGCVVSARLLGSIEIEQVKAEPGAEPERNDRLVARLSESRSWAHVDKLDQLGETFIDELNLFFRTYKELRGQSYKVLAVSGPQRAADLVEEWAA